MTAAGRVKPIRKVDAPANQNGDAEIELLCFVLAGDEGVVTKFVRDSGLAPEHFFGGSARLAYGVLAAAIRDGRPATIPAVAAVSVPAGEWLRDAQLRWYGSPAGGMTGGLRARENARVVMALAQKREALDALARLTAGIESDRPIADVAEGLRMLAGDLVRGESGPTIETFGQRELVEPLGDVPWVVPSLSIAPGAPTLLAGYAFSRKSLFGEGLLLSVASGVPFLGAYAVRKGTCLELQAEQGRRLTIDRYQRLARGHGVDLRDLAPDALRVSTLPPYLDAADAENVFCRATEGVTIAVLDSLRAMVPSLDENSSEVRRPLDMLTRVSERTGCTFVVIHHAGKPSADKATGAKFAPRGSSAIFDAVQTAFVLSADDGKVPSKVQHTKDRILGASLDDFSFSSDDVEIDGNPRAGLRLSIVDSAPEQVPAGDAHEKMMAKIVAYLRENGSVAGRNVLRARIGGKREAIYAAVDELEATRRIVNIGSRQKPDLRIAPP
ncbi:MAG: AAA family ATPase [Polyangiaceae bacterium]|nr:AAA family ATPase [Polyangiaceae bacterium]